MSCRVNLLYARLIGKYSEIITDPDFSILSLCRVYYGAFFSMGLQDGCCSPMEAAWWYNDIQQEWGHLFLVSFYDHKNYFQKPLCRLTLLSHWAKSQRMSMPMELHYDWLDYSGSTAGLGLGPKSMRKDERGNGLG